MLQLSPAITAYCHISLNNLQPVKQNTPVRSVLINTWSSAIVSKSLSMVSVRKIWQHKKNYLLLITTTSQLAQELEGTTVKTCQSCNRLWCKISTWVCSKGKGKKALHVKPFAAKKNWIQHTAKITTWPHCRKETTQLILIFKYTWEQQVIVTVWLCFQHSDLQPNIQMLKE